jgi:ABC-type glycerol-3-phosphate transport system permease component
MYPFKFPDDLQFINYKNAIEKGQLFVSYKNSFIITLSTLALVLLCSSTASLIFAKNRYAFKGRNILYFYVIIGMMIPVAVLFIPLFKMFNNLGLFNTRLSAIIIYTAKSIPFATFILTDFIRTIPDDFFEAADIDGAKNTQIYVRIVLPIIRPAIATAAIFTFRDVWNEYFMPLIFLRDPKIQTLPVGLARFMGQFENQWGMLYAGLNLVVFPLLIGYYISSRQFIRGITMGGIKS